MRQPSPLLRQPWYPGRGGSLLGESLPGRWTLRPDTRGVCLLQGDSKVIAPRLPPTQSQHEVPAGRVLPVPAWGSLGDRAS